MYKETRQPLEDDRRKSSWVRGLVEVKFRKSADSGLADFDFSKPLERTSHQKNWSPELSRRLTRNKLVSWRPSFPLRYSWSRESVEESRKFFFASGRDKLVTFRFPDDADVLRIARELQELPEVERANAVAKVAPPAPIQEPSLGTSDQDKESQWYAFRCKLPEALETVTGDGVIVAVLDWGFDELHTEYGPNIELKWNSFTQGVVVSEGGTPRHGTASMGLAGARLNNFGIVGFAPDSILWAIQAGHDAIVNHEDWFAAIDFVRGEPSSRRKVIILEIQTEAEGNIESIQAINQAITDAMAANIVVCVPAGNSPGDPSRDENGDIPTTNSILVGATDFHETHNFVNSREGSRIVVYAPGDPDNDLTCSPRNAHTRFFGGTSGAVAKVGGAVALMLEANPSLTPAQVRDILKRSNIPVLRDFNLPPLGVLLDCQKAVSEALNSVSEDEYVCPRHDD
ncbi:MAG TPA: S8/S53 family peptidase [Pyrinomonadaceae bacterium]|jgi:subtilisin family serine protease